MPLLRIPDVGVAFVCMGRRSLKNCADCGGVFESVRCDYPLGGARVRTCSRPLCDRCKKPWPSAAPVQLSPAYRRKHGGDLCRVHATMVEQGASSTWLKLMSCLRAGPPARRGLVEALERWTDLPTRIGALSDAATLGEGYVASGRCTRPEVLSRLKALAGAMRELAASMSASGQPIEVYEAERRAAAHLAHLTTPRSTP